MWFSGNGFSLPTPWHIVQSLNTSARQVVIGRNRRQPLRSSRPSNLRRKSRRLSAGLWQLVQESAANAVWFAGNGLMLAVAVARRAVLVRVAFDRMRDGGRSGRLVAARRRAACRGRRAGFRRGRGAGVAGLWQPVQESTGKDVWFAGNGLILPSPWHVVQSLYVSPSIGCGMAAGPAVSPPVSVVAPGVRRRARQVADGARLVRPARMVGRARLHPVRAVARIALLLALDRVRDQRCRNLRHAGARVSA